MCGDKCFRCVRRCSGRFLLRAKGCWFLSFYCSSRLPGGGVTFFAAAKKVTKESSFYPQARCPEPVACFNFAVAAIGWPPLTPSHRQPRDFALQISKAQWSAVIPSAKRCALPSGPSNEPRSRHAPSLHAPASHDCYLALPCSVLRRRARTPRRRWLCIEALSEVGPNNNYAGTFAVAGRLQAAGFL